jgi:ribosomal protein S2
MADDSSKESAATDNAALKADMKSKMASKKVALEEKKANLAVVSAKFQVTKALQEQADADNAKALLERLLGGA